MNPTLQITIPNFNRQDSLLTTLERLNSQWRGQFKVLILDDHSEVDPEAAIFERIDRANDWIQFLRHPVRLGLAANITSCFIHSNADWMWLLGNDDEVAPDAVVAIEQTVAQYPDVVFINFSSNLTSRQNTRLAAGLGEFLARLDDHANLNFISTGLYRVEAFKNYIASGFHYGYTLSPHLAMLFSLLRDHPDATAVFSSRAICRHKAAVNPKEQWSRIDFSYGAAAMLEFQGLTFGQRRRLADLLTQSGKIHEFLALQLLAEARRNSCGTLNRFMLETIVQRYFYFDRSLSRWIKKRLYPMLFISPHLSWGCLNLLFKLRGNRAALEKYLNAPPHGSWR